MNATRFARRRPSLSSLSRALCSAQRPTRAAFTLLELLLALGLMALMATVLIGGSAHLLSDKPASADEVFWKACAEARKAALTSGRDVLLSFADDREHGRRFIVNDGAGPRDFPVTLGVDLGVNFLSGQKTAGSAVVLAGQVVETQALPSVTFYADGTCTAFRVQIRSGVDAHILSIDPWTCAPVLLPPDQR
jgi:Tfp pilus assembly protein FimT